MCGFSGFCHHDLSFMHLYLLMMRVALSGLGENRVAGGDVGLC